MLGRGAGTEVTPIAQSSMKGHEKKRKRGAVCFASAVVTRDKDMAYTLVSRCTGAVQSADDDG